jgi:glycosyltransferase involved in cell wall biosynthesis
MAQKIGVDATTLTKNHNGGKNQVCLNLLRGFEKNGVAGRFVIFCLPEMTDDISKLTPNATVVTIHPGKIWKKTVTEIRIRTFILPRYLKKYQIGALLFPDSNTGIRRYKIPTVVVPNDIQAKTHKERFPFKARLFDSFFYHFDFKLRDRIVAMSDFDRQEITSIYPAVAKKIVKISNPIFTDYFMSASLHKGEHGVVEQTHVSGLFKNVQMQGAQKTEPRGVYGHTLSDTVCGATQQARRALQGMSVRVVPFRVFQQSQNPYITAVNIQHRHKNIITLIKAFEKIKDIIPHDLYLVGRMTADSEHLVSYVQEHRLSDRIIFKGFLDDTTLAEIIKGGALYVNPSLYEGFGMTCVEAMLAGAPTLVSRISAIPEVTMGLCDYYEPPDDAQALAEAIKGILLNKEKKTPAELEIISRKIYDQYNYIKISRQYFDLITSLMKD